MSSATLERIEADIRELPRSEQVRLMERLAQHIREKAEPPTAETDWDSQLAAMAADPDIRRELHRIEAEAMGTERG